MPVPSSAFIRMTAFPAPSMAAWRSRLNVVALVDVAGAGSIACACPNDGANGGVTPGLVGNTFRSRLLQPSIETLSAATPSSERKRAREGMDDPTRPARGRRLVTENPGAESIPAPKFIGLGSSPLTFVYTWSKISGFRGGRQAEICRPKRKV